MLMRDEIKAYIEAILFTWSEQLGLTEIAEWLDISPSDLKIILDELIAEYNSNKRGIQIVEVDDGYVMCTRPEYSDILSRIKRPVRRRLSAAAMETLAIIAYRQPVTRAEIEKIRGVKADKMIYNLLEKGLIQEAGHKPVAGKPILYTTTDEFLRVFGLASISQLPELKGD